MLLKALLLSICLSSPVSPQGDDTDPAPTPPPSLFTHTPQKVEGAGADLTRLFTAEAIKVLGRPHRPEDVEKVADKFLHTTRETSELVFRDWLPAGTAELRSMWGQALDWHEAQQATAQSAAKPEMPDPAPIFDSLLEKAPQDPMYLKYAGFNDLNRGRPEQAYERLDAAVGLGDTSPDTRYLRAAAAWSLGKTEQAHQDAAAVLKTDPGHKAAEALFKLTKKKIDDIAFRSPKGKPAPGSEALPSLPGRAHGADRTVREEDPASRLLAQAERRLAVRDRDGALALVDQALAEDPDSPRALQLKAELLLRDGRFEEALPVSTRLLELAPDNAAALNMRALALNRLRRFLEALRDAEAALRSKPRSSMGYFNRAFAQAGLGRRQEAARDLEKAAALDSRYLAKLDRLKALAADADAALVFGDEDASARAPSAPQIRRTSPWVYGLFGCLGAALLALGLFRRAKAGASTARRLMAESLGTEDLLLGRYRIERELASGGMGTVYEGMDQALDRKVAVKRMRPEIRAVETERRRFLDEAKTVARLRHPNIVEIYSVEEDGEEAYLIFEFVRGRTLSVMIEEGGPLHLRQAKDILKAVCGALDYAHGMGVIHRDLKPSNVMIDAQGTVKVMDFGVARQAREALGRLALTQTVCGTPAYMAPEQERGFVGRGTDVYALGVCFYEMLTGRRPFEGDPAEAGRRKLSREYPPASNLVPGLPASLDGVLARALEPSPEARFQSAGELVAALDRADQRAP
ncbi:MAG: protein kinase [Elusimicrobiota bacterium]